MEFPPLEISKTQHGPEQPALDDPALSREVGEVPGPRSRVPSNFNQSLTAIISRGGESNFPEPIEESDCSLAESMGV